MINVSIKEGGHKWTKINQVTQRNRKGLFDNYVCKCGLKGKSYQLGVITVRENINRRKLSNCPFFSRPTNSKRIRITNCTAVGPLFGNLTPGSEHDVIETPKEHLKTESSGVWVQGVGEPVKVLNNEFTYIKD